MTAESNTVAVVNGVSDLTAPHTLLRMTGTFFANTIADGGADLLDPRSRERGGDVEGGVDVTLEASKGVGTSETGRAAIKSLSFYL